MEEVCCSYSYCLVQGLQQMWQPLSAQMGNDWPSSPFTNGQACRDRYSRCEKRHIKKIFQSGRGPALLEAELSPRVMKYRSNKFHFLLESAGERMARACTFNQNYKTRLLFILLCLLYFPHLVQRFIVSSNIVTYQSMHCTTPGYIWTKCDTRSWGPILEGASLKNGDHPDDCKFC